MTQRLVPLLPHPASPAFPGVNLEAEVQRTRQGLRLRYLVAAPRGLLQLPAAVTPAFADGLWRHTCLEAFVAPTAGAHYREFNFSPSGQYAEYHFADERVRLDDAPLPTPPELLWTVTAQGIELVAQVALAGLPPTQDLLIGLTAVLEDRPGQVSHWALHHPKDRPDFHDRRGWTLRLPSFHPSHPC